MRKRALSICLPIGLSIFLVYELINRFIKISDGVTIPLCIVSIILMMIGLAYNGWCFGKRRNPYDKA